MDPNANLDEQRRIVARILSNGEHDDVSFHDVDRLIDLVQAMDEWLSKGGALPAEWVRK